MSPSGDAGFLPEHHQAEHHLALFTEGSSHSTLLDACGWIATRAKALHLGAIAISARILRNIRPRATLTFYLQ